MTGVDGLRERQKGHLTCDNETGRQGATNTETALTRPSDLGGGGAGVSLPIEERLWPRVRHTETGCWEWTGTIVGKGYGAIRYNGKSWRTHRVAYTLAKGPIPDGMCVMHRCDNPPCINPNHLQLGTIAENNQDRHDKGRTIVPEEWHGWQRAMTHCRRGHEFTDDNVYLKSGGNGVRECRTCRRIKQSQSNARRAQRRAEARMA